MKKIIILFLAIMSVTFSVPKVFKDYQIQTIYGEKELFYRLKGIDDENFYEELKTLLENEYYPEETLDELYNFEVKNGLTDNDFKELYKVYNSDIVKKFQIYDFLEKNMGKKYSLPSRYKREVIAFFENKFKEKEQDLINKHNKKLLQIKSVNREKYIIEEQKLFKKYTDKKSDKELQENIFNYLEQYRNGNSYENAIRASDVKGEYEYLEKIYGKNLRLKTEGPEGLTLEDHGSESYEIITVIDDVSNREIKYYFEISSFFKSIYFYR